MLEFRVHPRGRASTYGKTGLAVDGWGVSATSKEGIEFMRNWVGQETFTWAPKQLGGSATAKKVAEAHGHRLDILFQKWVGSKIDPVFEFTDAVVREYFEPPWVAELAEGLADAKSAVVRRVRGMRNMRPKLVA